MKNIGDFYLKIFSFLEVKFSIYLNRRVFVMIQKNHTLSDTSMTFSGFLLLNLLVEICALAISNFIIDLQRILACYMNKTKSQSFQRGLVFVYHETKSHGLLNFTEHWVGSIFNRSKLFARF